jgi:transposase
MARPQNHPLRPLAEGEHAALSQLSRSPSRPAGEVARATALLAVAAGQSFAAAARAAGRRCGDAVARLVIRFNAEGVAAVVARHGGGRAVVYGAAQQARILAEARRPPDREQDATATWSLRTLQRALRRAPDGLPTVSTFTIWTALHAAGLSWQRSRSWCDTGSVVRVRKAGPVEVDDPDAVPKRRLIEAAYTLGEQLGLAVWTEDEAGPFQTVPYPGTSWQPAGEPVHQPHEYQRAGTAKLLTLFHPASGQVRVKGVTRCTNAVLHPWLQAELTAILAALPAPSLRPPADEHALWAAWQAGLTICPTLPADPPPLRLLLVLDNLAGHLTPDFVCWLFAQGILPLYTPLGGSWLNMAESIQRILKRRALDGHQPTTTDEIIAWLEAAARGWNAAPTAFQWGGKRQARRQRSRARRHCVGGSGAWTDRPVQRVPAPVPQRQVA